MTLPTVVEEKIIWREERIIQLVRETEKLLCQSRFKNSDIDPCLWLGNGMTILSYVSDCGPSIEKILIPFSYQ